MKRLTDRKDIAQALNFGKYPVIKIDLADKDSYGIKGTKVRIDYGKDYYCHAVIRAYNDTKYLQTNASSTVLSASHGYDDYLDMVDYAAAPIIKANQDIVICLFDSDKKVAYPPVILTTGRRVYPHNTTPLDLDKVYVID